MSKDQDDTFCPHCGSEEIEGASIEIDDGQATQEMTCTVCHSTWNNTYVFDGIENFEVPERTRMPSPPPRAKLETMSELVKRYLNVARDNGFCYDMLTQVFGPGELLRTNLVFTGDLDLTYDEIFKCICEAKSILMKEERPRA